MKLVTIITLAALTTGAACTTANQNPCELGDDSKKGGSCVVPSQQHHEFSRGEAPEKPEGAVSRPTPPDAPTSTPSTPPSEPEHTPDVDEDTPDADEDTPKGDNSDANGKGGNKHDRDDFTHGGTEEAEDKKDD